MLRQGALIDLNGYAHNMSNFLFRTVTARLERVGGLSPRRLG